MNINKVNTRVIPLDFEYHAPATLEEAVSLLSRLGREAKLLAGGTDLLVEMKQGLLAPRHVISLRRIGSLRFIREEAGAVRIGAMATLRDLENSGLVREKLTTLHEASSSVGSVQVKSMGTVGGNVCHASPAADTASALLALNAWARIVGPRGEREVGMVNFFLGPRRTVLAHDEILTELVVPLEGGPAGSSFLKVGRTSADIAKVNVATLVRLSGGVVGECRIALGSVAPTPIRAVRAEEFLRGREPSEENADEAARIAAGEAKPITDVRSTVEYRRELCRVLVRRSLLLSAARASR